MTKQVKIQLRSDTAQSDISHALDLLSQGFTALSLRQSHEAAVAFYEAGSPREDIIGIEAMVGSAIACLQANEDEEAVAFALSALSLITGDANEARALGQTYLDLDKPQYAAVFLRVALAMLPDDTDVMYCLANALLDSKDYEEGLTIARRAVECNPQDGHANATLGRALVLNNKHEEAMEPLERAIGLLDDKRWPLLQLALCLDRCGRWEEAHRKYEEAAAAGAPKALTDLGIAQILLHTGQIHESKALVERVLQRQDAQDALEAEHAEELSRPDAEPRVYQLKISLKDARPPIWRRVLVDSSEPLGILHYTIQAAMGWEDDHLHHFTVNGIDYTSPEFIDDAPDPFGRLDEWAITLDEAVPKAKNRFTYTYDYGDDWRHNILVEKIMPFEPGMKLPICTGGARACPPEDVGGVWGYLHFLLAISDSSHEEHDQWLEWIGGSFDPERFDPEDVNRRLSLRWRDAQRQVSEDGQED